MSIFRPALVAARAKLGYELVEFQTNEVDTTGLVFLSQQETEAVLHLIDLALDPAEVPYKKES